MEKEYEIILYIQGAGKMPRTFFETQQQFWRFLEALRPAEKRPSHLIYKAPDITIEDITKILWTPQILRIVGEKLYGGMGYTRKYLTRLIAYEFSGYKDLQAGENGYCG